MPDKDPEIKKIGAEDAAVLRAIALKAYSEHYADTWYDNGRWYLQTYFSIEHLQAELHDVHAAFFVIYDADGAIGFLKLNLEKPLPGTTENALELERIYLTKAASGRGIGTQVLQFVFSTARQMKKEIVWLKAMDSNPGAVRFYKKRGFEICGTHTVAFPQKKENMRGMYIMRKRL